MYKSPSTRHHTPVQPSSSIPPLSQPNPSPSPHRSTTQSPIPVTSPQSSNPQNLSLGGVPKISIFSGDKKSDILYDQWKYEMECLQTDGYADHVICLAIRRSLWFRVLMRLGPNATVNEILYKLDSIYGLVEERESL